MVTNVVPELLTLVVMMVGSMVRIELFMIHIVLTIKHVYVKCCGFDLVFW